jgi:hypothetical protein
VVAIVLASLLLLLALGIEARAVLFFHAVTPWSSPQRIHYCGRDYPRGNTVPAAQAEDAEDVASLRVMTRGPLFQPIYGNPAGAQQRAAGAPCTMALFIRDGDGYDVYDLAGGP